MLQRNANVFARRRFLGYLAVLSSTLLPVFAQASRWRAPTIIRSRPNPHDGHLSTIAAAELCALRERSLCFSDHCLDLIAYRSASIDGLHLLAKKEWFLADFGLTDLSLDTAHALASIQIGASFFHHVEHANAEAVAILSGTWDEMYFDNVLALDTGGFKQLAKLMSSRYSSVKDASMEFCVDFEVSGELADIMKSLPFGVNVWRKD
jgi:hypothetical protein